jgi:hypothetical protein
MQPALEAAFRDLVLGPEPAFSDARAAAAWLSSRGISAPDARAIAETELEGLSIHRELARERLAWAIARVFERTAFRLGAAFDAYVARFLAGPGPRGHSLRELSHQFLEFCTPLWQREPLVPDYLTDLARHEWLGVEVAAAAPHTASSAREQQSAVDAPLSLELGLAFSESCRLVRYRYAVQRLSEAPEGEALPEPLPTALLAFRDHEHEVCYLELTPRTATLVDALLLGASLAAALERAGAARQGSTLTECGSFLAELVRRGAIDAPRPARELESL